MEQKNQHYVVVNGEKVFVAREVYEAYMRPVWQEDKRRERESRCVSASGRGVCREDCSLCSKEKSPRVISLDSIQADGNDDIPSPVSVEVLAERKELYSALHREINRLPEDDIRLIRMEWAGVCVPEAASALGISTSQYYRRKIRIFKALQARLKIFFED